MSRQFTLTINLDAVTGIDEMPASCVAEALRETAVRIGRGHFSDQEHGQVIYDQATCVGGWNVR
jgi:hypothetical protein